MAINNIKIKGVDLFGDFFNISGLYNSTAYCEKHWTWPPEIGSGTISLIYLRPGLVLGMGAYSLRERITVDFNVDISAFAFTFSVTGGIRHKITVRSDYKDLWHVKERRSIMTYLPEWSGVSSPPVGAVVDCVCVFVEPMLLNSFLQGDCYYIPQRLSNIMRGAYDRIFYHEAALTSAVHTIIEQIIHCPYKNALKRLYYESKSLELLTHYLADFKPAHAVKSKNTTLKIDDVERVRKAGEILLQSFEKPPGLVELAGRVGMNKNKLNRGFHELYGKSVFDYYRVSKLEYAKQLLETTEKNVTEVAFELGYAQHGNFTKAFKKHFGVAPSHVIK